MVGRTLPKALVVGTRILLEPSEGGRELVDKHGYGSHGHQGSLELSSFEACYLAEREKIVLQNGREKAISVAAFSKKVLRADKRAWHRYKVFCVLRDRGYIVKTALKFGADFRVYDRGVQPGEDHARWLVYAMPETEAFRWSEFSGKNRVAHSTKKKLLIGVVDEEGDVSFWECRWLSP